ncbi:MAG TPA: hypothetical protein VGK34_04805 [Armatimonadota bacterium]
MKSMKRFLVCIVILLAVPSIMSADPARNGSTLCVTGRVIAVSADRSLIDIRRNSSKCVTIEAGNAFAFDGDRGIRLLDIHRGDLVQCVGLESGDRLVAARSIHRLDVDPAFRDTDTIKVQGVIRKIDRSRRWLDIEIGQVSRRIRLSSDTKICDLHRNGVSADYLQKNQDITIEGYVVGMDEIVASTLSVGGSDRRMRPAVVRVTASSGRLNHGRKQS